MIRIARPEDGDEVARIYNHYVKNTAVTFEEVEVSGEEMSDRISGLLGEGLPWYVCEAGDKLIGYAYAGKWKGRCAYRFSVESTIYLSQDFIGQGRGRPLYRHLLNDLKEKGYHSIMGGIALPNKGSQNIHEYFGFRKIAHFEEVGWKLGKWIDVGYWQLIL